MASHEQALHTIVKSERIMLWRALTIKTQWGLSARLFGWGSGGSRVRWCQGLGCRGGGPGGGSTVLLGGARALALPGHHGRVGGVVAGVWRSVAVSVGRGENLFYLWTDRRRRRLFPS